LKINRFGQETGAEWDTAVASLLSAGKPGALVIDLRNDPGGYLDQAVNLASDFIPSGPVVWQQYGDGRKVPLNVSRSARLIGVKLIVLINEGSASAAEILAGALKEKAGATLVGEKSFGKGSVQQAKELANGAGIHITIAKWLTPNGNSIDKVGISPDVEVKQPEAADPTKPNTNDAQLSKALELAGQ
jgi:carboxyl-terminal processing protease